MVGNFRSSTALFQSPAATAFALTRRNVSITFFNPVNGSGDLLQASYAQMLRQAQVEVARAAMQRAMDGPGLDALAIAELA